MQVCCPAPKGKVKEVDRESGKEASDNVTEAVRQDVVAFSMQVQICKGEEENLDMQLMALEFVLPC